MITLKTLTWSDCFSYGPDNVLQLDAESLTQIIGTNGTGKSSIPLIIEEALYNKNSKNVKKADIANRYIGDKYHINLTFSKDGSDYEVDVSRSGAKAKVKLSENGEDISSHTATNTYKTLQSILGVDFKTFSQLVYQSTNTSLQFLSATDTQRKKFLIDLLHLEVYLELLEVFKEAHKEVATTAARLESKVQTIEKWFENNNLESTTPQELLEVRIETGEDEKELGSLTQQLENLHSENEKINKNNQYRKRLSQMGTPQPDTRQIESYDKFNTDIGTYRYQINTATKEIEEMRELGDQCPKCKQAVDTDAVNTIINNAKQARAEAREKLAEAGQEVTRIKSTNEEILENREIQRQWEELYRRIDTDLPSTFHVESDLSQRIDELRSKIRQARQQEQKAQLENEKRMEHNARIKVIAEQSEKYSKELDEAARELADFEQKVSNLEILKRAFGTNGILAYKIENLVKDLEDLTNHYLAELSQGRFTLEFQVSKDKLNVVITDNGNAVDISALSSGELARVNTSTLIAIRRLMSSISKSKINVLFLDEVIAVLDDLGREKLVEILVQEEDLNTYIVSHHWEHPLLTKLSIVKDEEISHIES